MSLEIPPQYRPISSQFFSSPASPRNFSTSSIIKQTISNTDAVITRGKALTKAIAYGNYFKRIAEKGDTTAKKQPRFVQHEKTEQILENKQEQKRIEQSRKQVEIHQNIKYFKDKERINVQSSQSKPPMKCVQMIKRYYANLNFTNPMTFQDHSYSYNSRIHPLAIQSEQVSPDRRSSKSRKKQKLQITQVKTHTHESNEEDCLQINNIHETSSLEINDSIVGSVLMKDKHYFDLNEEGQLCKEQKMFQSNKTYQANAKIKAGALKNQFLMTFRVQEAQREKNNQIKAQKQTHEKQNPLLMSNERKIHSIFSIKEFNEPKIKKNTAMIPHFRATLEEQLKKKNEKLKRNEKQRQLSSSYLRRTSKDKHKTPSKDKNIERSLIDSQIIDQVNKFNEFMNRKMEEQKHSSKSKQKHHKSHNRSKQRNWISANEEQINSNLKKIFKYKLVQRYLSQGEVRNHLSGYMIAHVDPRRWILLIVDEVYKKIRQRYPGETK